MTGLKPNTGYNNNMKKGFITYVNDSHYLELCKILVESVLKFSQYPIQVFCINFDYNFNNDKVFSTRIDISGNDHISIWNAKPKMAMSSMFDYGLMIDSDVIITKDLDKIFDEHNPEDLTYPICPIHQHEVFAEKYFMDLFGLKERTQRWVHADAFLYSHKTNDFLNEWYKTNLYLQKNNTVPNVGDESVLNLLLWKHNQKNWYAEIFEPYYDLFYDCSRENLIKHGYEPDWNIRHYMYHGCKNPTEAKEILEKIISLGK